MTPLDLAVRVSIVLGAAWASAGALRSRPAALRHWLLAAGLFGAAVAPALALVAPSWRLPSRRVAPAVASAAAVTTAVANTSAPSHSTGTRETVVVHRPTVSVAAIVAGVWVGGAAVGLLLLAIGLARLARIAARAEPLDDGRWRAIRDDIARAYGVRRDVRLLQTDRPMLVTWGIVAPKILVPRGASDWSDDRVRIVLAHELAHVARGDWLAQLLAQCVRAAHWCNPLAWIVCHRARLEAEHACDDAVLNLGVEGSEYASHLLALARSMHTRRAAWVPAQAIVRPSSLERRVAAMLNARVNHAPLSRAGRFAATVAVLFMTVAAAGFSAAQATTLSGIVVDQLGGPIAGAAVSVVDLTTNDKHVTQSDAAGRYALSGLAAGDYMLTVTTAGFEPYTQRVVLSGAAFERNVRMTLGTIQESITITNGAAVVNRKPVDREAIQRKVAAIREQVCDVPGGCIRPPIKVFDKKVIYPDAYTGPGEVVTLKATIDTTGHVTNLQVVGNPNPDLAQAARVAVAEWEFEPTRLDNVVVETAMTVTVSFAPAK